MAAIVYDTGALLAAERHSPDFLALHDEVTAARIRPLVPVVVLAQAWRGGQIGALCALCAFRSAFLCSYGSQGGEAWPW